MAWGVLLLSLVLPREGVGVPACPSRLITGVPCPGCGLTRSVTSLAHFDLQGAWLYNPFGPAAFLIIAWFALRPVLGLERARRVERAGPMRAMGWVFLVLFVGHGVGRAVGVFPDHTSLPPNPRATPAVTP